MGGSGYMAPSSACDRQVLGTESTLKSVKKVYTPIHSELPVLPSQALSPAFWGSGILLCMPPVHSTPVKGSNCSSWWSLQEQAGGSAALCYQSEMMQASTLRVNPEKLLYNLTWLLHPNVPIEM